MGKMQVRTLKEILKDYRDDTEVKVMTEDHLGFLEIRQAISSGMVQNELLVLSAIKTGKTKLESEEE